MSEPIQTVRVSNAELATVRQAMRELNRLIGQLEHGQLEKIVLTQRNQMRAVLITLERYTELEQHAGRQQAAGAVLADART
jgi:PHD/YefM family antitoxin component YafN of YafNO toxin-antitoxin module